MLTRCVRAVLRRHTAIRSCSSAFLKPRRFYKEVQVQQLDDNLYETHLDSRVLKTPKNQQLHIDSHALALAIAQEWDEQGETINVPQMRLTGLQFTVVDNPTNETRETLIEKIIEFIDTDTLLYFNDSPKELRALQEESWMPIVDWANDKHQLTLRPTYTIVDMPTILDDSRRKLHEYFAEMQFAALIGVIYGVDALKSVLLMMACLQFRLDTRAAADLALLEQRYQTKIYKKIEGAHDVQKCEMLNRLSAAVLFAQLHANKHCQKDVQSAQAAE